MKHLGSISMKGLLEDNLDFDEKELGKHKASDLPGFGFLSIQPGGSKLRPTRRYGFLHKTFQEFFAGFYLSCQLIKQEISTNSIAADRKYRHELKEVLLFTYGMLAARCRETAPNLLKSITYWGKIELVMTVLLLWVSVWNITHCWQTWIWGIMKLVMMVLLLWVSVWNLTHLWQSWIWIGMESVMMVLLLWASVWERIHLWQHWICVLIKLVILVLLLWSCSGWSVIHLWQYTWTLQNITNLP